MQTIKVKDYGTKRGMNIKKRLLDYWKTLQKNKVHYLFVILFIQIFNLLLILLLIPYVWGSVFHLVILGILVSVLIFKWLRNPKFLLFITIFIIPIVLLSFIIIVLLVGFQPHQSFPSTWKYSDNNASRMTTEDKFRVSQIELRYPVTFKATVEEITGHVKKWMDENSFNYKRINLTNSASDNRTGLSYSFSNYNFETLFGVVNDMHIQVIE